MLSSVRLFLLEDLRRPFDFDGSCAAATGCDVGRGVSDGGVSILMAGGGVLPLLLAPAALGVIAAKLAVLKAGVLNLLPAAVAVPTAGVVGNGGGIASRPFAVSD